MKILNFLSSKRFFQNINVIQILLDILLLNGSFMFSIFIRWGNLHVISNTQIGQLALVLNLGWLLVVLWLHVVKPVRMERISLYLFRLINTMLHHMLLIGLIIFIFKFSEVSRLLLCYFYILFFISLITLRIGILITIKNLRKRGYNYRNIVFAGWDGIANQYYDVIHLDLASGYKILGYFEDKLIENVPINYLGDIHSLKDFFKKDNIDELFISSQSFSKEQVKELVVICEANMTRVRFIPNVIQYGLTSNFDVVRYGHLPTFSLRKEPMEKLVNRMIKRTFDIVFSSLVILFVFSWLFPIIAILIKFSSKGPVFFKQLRSGENNRTFYCYKFRTMKVNTKSDKLQATKGDSRITKIGAFLRKTSIDELPQFFNVLFGSMSVVGPRPHMLLHTEQYSNDINNFMVRHFIKPGITGWAQVKGYRGETKKLEDMEKRVKYDIWYLENWNIFFDFKIIYLTILNVIYGDSKAY